MHLLSACPRYAPNLYIKRRNKALKVIYYHERHTYELDEELIYPYDNRNVETEVSNKKSKTFENFGFNTRCVRDEDVMPR